MDAGPRLKCTSENQQEAILRCVGDIETQEIVRLKTLLDDREEEAITSSSHIRLIRWTQPVSRNRSRNTNESQ